MGAFQMKILGTTMAATMLATITLLGFVGCQNANPAKGSIADFETGTAKALRPMTPAEAANDFDEIVTYFRAYYGPMEYKEQRFQFKFDDWVSEIKTELTQAKSDDQIFGLYAKFISRFQDGHVGISFPINSTGAMTYKVPIYIAPMGDTYIVADSSTLKNTAIAKGDEVLSVDGKTMPELLSIITKYSSLARPESNRHFIYKALVRDFYITELRPTRNTVNVVFKKPDGKVMSEDFVWSIVPTVKDTFIENQKLALSVPGVAAMQAAAGASLMTMSKPMPFFATPEVLKKYAFQRVTADEAHRAQFGLAENEKPEIFAAMYKFEGKNVLLVRNYVYSHSDFSNVAYMKLYKAILNQWEPFTDVLVLDQTHNGGGSYCEEFFRLFIKEQKNAFVESLHVDRKWIDDLVTWGKFIVTQTGSTAPESLFLAMGATVEKAYDAGLTMTAPLAIIGGRNKVQPADYTWKKPMLVLIDELAGSCGDAFPMLIKNNAVAKLFGANTMGLGGNIEALNLTYSRSSLRVTRGLFTSYRDDQKYTPEMMIENNGVAPDYPYQHTLQDFRDGFIGYVDAFSKKALEQIPAR